MTVVGFNFTKIDVEREKEIATGKIDIKNNVNIANVEEHSFALAGNSQKVAKFTFNFNTSYEPRIGKISFIGNILYLSDTKKVEELINSWKKDKKVSNEITALILNTVLNRCNIQALILSQQINLPPPIPMPKVTAEKPKE